MSGVIGVVGASGGGARPLAGGSASGAAEASFTVGTDGVVTLNGTTRSPLSENWYVPTTTGIGSAHWARFSRTSGNALYDNTSSVDWGQPTGWQQLTAPLTYGYKAAGGGGRSGVFKVEIAADAAGVNIVTSGSYTLTIT